MDFLKEIVKEIGDDFNIRDFHDTVLGNGAVPLDILEKHVNEYISHKQ